MSAITAPVEVAAAFDALDAAVAAIGELNFERLRPAVRLRALQRLETSRRRQVAVSHDVIAGLERADPAAIGGPAHKVIADWLRISCAEARRRINDVTQLSARVTLSGGQLPPQLPATAHAWRAGLLDGQHLRVIQTFVRELSETTPADTVAHAERFLAHQATQLRPDQLDKLAQRCALLINPDGTFADADRARQRGFTWHGQRSDGMSIATLIATPELRANLDAWLARFAAPGMCNPDNP
ncbi:maturase, partial [Mycobacterium decipiens]